MLQNLNVMYDASERLEYNNPQVPIRVVKGNLEELTGRQAICHWHPDVEFLIPLQGEMDYHVSGREYQIRQGQGIFVNSRRLHFGYSRQGENCRYGCVVVQPKILAGNAFLYEKYFSPVLDVPGPDALILDSENPSHDAILSALLQVLDIYEADCPGQELHTISLLTGVWANLLCLFPRESEPRHRNSEVMRQILAYLYEHGSEHLTPETLSRAGGVSRTCCFQLFRDYLGTTPMEYVNEYRLERAMELLRTTQAPITEIASACGFTSSSYFAELFRSKKGCSPSAYRTTFCKSPQDSRLNTIEYPEQSLQKP